MPMSRVLRMYTADMSYRRLPMDWPMRVVAAVAKAWPIMKVRDCTFMHTW